jgi:hypothetical protein
MIMKTRKTKSFAAFLIPVVGLMALHISGGPTAALAQAEKSDSSPKAKAPAKLPPAKEVIDKFVTAIGGKEAFAKVTSQHAKGKFELAGQGISGNLEVFAKRPNKLLIKINIAAIGDILRGFDGEVGWSTDAAMGPALMKGKELDQTREQANFDHLLHDEKDIKSMETVEVTQFEGKECYKLKLVTKLNSEVTEYYDTKTGLQVGFVGTQESALGPLVVTSISSDYKKFGDVLFATRVVQKMGPLEQVMIINSFELNKVADSVFDLPAPIKALIKK